MIFRGDKDYHNFMPLTFVIYVALPQLSMTCTKHLLFFQGDHVVLSIYM